MWENFVKSILFSFEKNCQMVLLGWNLKSMKILWNQSYYVSTHAWKGNKCPSNVDLKRKKLENVKLTMVFSSKQFYHVDRQVQFLRFDLKWFFSWRHISQFYIFDRTINFFREINYQGTIILIITLNWQILLFSEEKNFPLVTLIRQFFCCFFKKKILFDHRDFMIFLLLLSKKIGHFFTFSHKKGTNDLTIFFAISI